MFFSDRSKILLGGICLLLGLSGCESVRETLGMNQSAPDEFSESPFGRDLTIPPSFKVLPEPKSAGAEKNPFGTNDPSQLSPAEKQTQTSGQAALLGKIPQTNSQQRSQPTA